MRAGIALDDWKLPVFRRRLSDAGFSYEDGGSINGKSTMLYVETDDLDKLADVVQDCQVECARIKR